MFAERSTLVEECYRLADEARRLANMHTVAPDERADLLEVEQRWLSLARSCQQGGSLSSGARQE
jgi:hypothetical protein